jgi:hypothetical protein
LQRLPDCWRATKSQLHRNAVSAAGPARAAQSCHVQRELVKLPPGCKAIGSQWVFKVKRNTNGSVECYKVRVAAKGFSQRPGVDFDKTFAPTTKWAALRVIFALAGA